MINFTSRYINALSLIISVIIYVFLNNYIFSIQRIGSFESFISNQLVTQIEEHNNSIKDITKESDKSNTANLAESDEQQKVTNDWQLEIPSINLKAQIAEGTTKEVMDEYIGHFEETSKDTGNIGLAAHNRGYNVNYFQDLKKLKEGDEIIYKYNGKQIKYTVKTLKIIKDTDWTLLENSEKNKITLITCVENQPEYRRCVQAEEII